jgi:hypothetical protein
MSDLQEATPDRDVRRSGIYAIIALDAKKLGYLWSPQIAFAQIHVRALAYSR